MVENVVVNGLSKGALDSYTFADVQANQTIGVSFVMAKQILRPVVSGTTPTRDTTPTWTWTSGGGIGAFRIRLDNSAWVTTKAKGFTPAKALTAGSHTLQVQERDAAGNWSLSGKKKLVIDTTSPLAPGVKGVTPTKDTTPTWTWSRGGGGNGVFRYRLDSGAWVATKVKGFTPATALAVGSHNLQVQERDAAGNWSLSGKKKILIDLAVH